MPILIISAFFQVLLIAHVIKTGRERYWIALILLFPFLGGIVYFVMEVLPDIKAGRVGRKASRQILTAIDPQRDLKERARELALSDNVHNKIELAQECVRFGIYEDAIKLYRDSLTGIYAHDPNIMLGLADALFQQEDYAACRETLEQLIEQNPDFKSQAGHLLYARTLEALQDSDAAIQEYRVLNDYYSGYEAKCRYALLLRKLGRSEQADQLFNEILQRSAQLSSDRRKLQKEWIQIAKAQLA